MKIIDAHCHIHRNEWVKKNSPEDFLIKEFNIQSSEDIILKNMTEAGINQTIIFPLPSLSVDLDTANNYTVQISAEYPDKFIPFTIIDHFPEKWFRIGVRGFKEHTFGQRLQKDKYGNDIFSQEFKKTYRFMEKMRLPLLLHAGVNRVDRIKKDILKNTPDLIIILAHLGADFDESYGNTPQIQQVINTLKLLKNFSSIFFDISAITDINIIRESINITGIDKIIFGSDFPYEKPKLVLERISKLNLNETDIEKLLYGNILNAIGEI